MNKFDRKKLKSKMFAVYIFCVIIPVIATNCFVTMIVINNEQKKTQEALTNITSAAKYEFISSIDEAVSSTKAVYSKKELCLFLEKIYNSPLEYFNALRDLNEVVLLDYGYKSRISEIGIYTDNSTVLSGGRFFKLTDYKDTEWYKTYESSSKRMIICIYYDEEDGRRRVSLIRDMDNYSGKRFSEKLIKVEISYYNQQSEMDAANYDADVYIVSGGKIIFSNTEEKDGRTEYNKFDFDTVTKGKAYAKQNLSYYGTDFTIYSIAREGSNGTVLLSYAWLVPIILLFNVVVPILVISAVNKSICGRILLLGGYFEKMKQENFALIPEQPNGDEIAELIHSYNLTAEKMQELIESAYKSKIERQNLLVAKQQAELLALYSQINPHFLFNTLESIRMRSVIKNESETADIISKLALLMRNSISWKSDVASIGSEIDFVRAYLELQKYRFGNRLSYDIKVNRACRAAEIPKLTIVTFTENACVHGIEGSPDGGTILINVEPSGKNIRIEIEDTGIGMNEEKAQAIRELFRNADTEMLDNMKRSGERQSIGMLNAVIRLKSFFNGNVGLEIDTEEGGGTLITITIPSGNENNKEDTIC